MSYGKNDNKVHLIVYVKPSERDAVKAKAKAAGVTMSVYCVNILNDGLRSRGEQEIGRG